MASRSPRGPGRSNPRKKSTAPTGARAPARPKKAAPVKAGTGPQLTTRAIVLVTVMLLLLASYTTTLHAWWEQRGEIRAEMARIETSKQAISDLEDDATRWNDPAYVKQQARERFGWVMPNEVGYRVIGSDGTVQGNVPTLDAPPVPHDKPWYGKLLSSVEKSGLTPEQLREPESDEVLKKK